MVLLIIIPIKWLFHWEYTQHFQTNPCDIKQQDVWNKTDCSGGWFLSWKWGNNLDNAILHQTIYDYTMFFFAFGWVVPTHSRNVFFQWPGIPLWFCWKLPWTNQRKSAFCSNFKECLSWKLCCDSQKLDVLSSFPQHSWHILRWVLPISPSCSCL